MEATSSQAAQLPFFPQAPQPSLIRAQQKDELYLQYLAESCHDVVRRLLGPRSALLWSRETKLLAELLYYTLTTGSGLQTLGEEYCDVLQASGDAGVQPGAVRRGALVVLQSLGPYLAEKAAARHDDEFVAWRAARLRAPHAAVTPPQPPSARDAALQLWQQLRHRVALTAEQLRARVEPAMGPLQRWWPEVAAFVRDNGPALSRLHLALFYITGVYYQLPKRVAGVRYAFLGRLFERRPSYRALGAVLLLQLGVSPVLWALRRYAGIPQLRQLELGAPQPHVKPRHAALQREDGSEEAEAVPGAAQRAEQGEGEVPAALRCPLCLSRRTAPTATPCGHVFCWRCVAEWCTLKPECPLCRAEVAPSALVRVHHADF